MTIGLSIFLVGVLFALIYLYSITRDRWRWGQIVAWSVIPLVLTVTGFAYLGVWLIGENYHYWGHYWVLALGAAGVIFQLWRLTRSKWDWLKIRDNTVKIAGALFVLVGGYYGYQQLGSWYEVRQRGIAAQREDAARVCNAREIERFEPLLKAAISEVRSSMTSEQIRSILEKIGATPVVESRSLTNIKQKELSLLVTPNCDSLFKLAIFVTWSESGLLRHLKTWAVSAPQGYPPTSPSEVDISDLPAPRRQKIPVDRLSSDPFWDIPISGASNMKPAPVKKEIAYLSVDFEAKHAAEEKTKKETQMDADRRRLAREAMAKELAAKQEEKRLAEEREQLAQKKKQEEKRLAEEREQLAQKQRQEVLNRIVVVNLITQAVLPNCNDSCSSLLIDFDIRNDTSKRLHSRFSYGVSYGYTVVERNSSCPLRLSPSGNLTSLEAGESKHVSTAVNLPPHLRRRDSWRACVLIVDVKF